MTFADVLKNVVLPILTLLTCLGMLYVSWLFVRSPEPFGAVPCLMLACVSGFFSFLDARKIYRLLSK
jgi:hypothetical protein